MLEHAVTLGLVVQCAKCRGMWWHWVQKGVMTQAAGVQSIDNLGVLGKCCRGSTVLARAVGVLSSTSRSSS